MHARAPSVARWVRALPQPTDRPGRVGDRSGCTEIRRRGTPNMSVTSLAAQLSRADETGELFVGQLAAVSLAPFTLAIALHLGRLTALARAWHNIVRAAYPSDRVHFREALTAFLAGVGVGAVVPSRVGALVRLGLLRGRVAGATFPGLVSTLLAEQAFETIVKVLLVGIAVAIGLGAGVPGATFVVGPLADHLLAAMLLGAGVVLVLGWLGVRRRARIRSFLREARRGFAVFTPPTRYLRTVVSWQALAWALRLASVYAFLVAFHVSATVEATFLVVGAQLVAAIVPTPGGVGSQQAMLVVALSATTAMTVLGFGVGMQAATVLTDLMLGAASLIALTGSLRWRRLALRRDTPGPSPAAQPQRTSGL
jgi:hypothetical protein